MIFHRSKETKLTEMVDLKQKNKDNKSVQLNDIPKALLTSIGNFLENKSKTHAKESCKSLKNAINNKTSVIASYENLKKAILMRIIKYQQGYIVMGDRDGIYNGLRGKYRATIAAQYAKVINVNDRLGIMALMFAIFKPKSFAIFGYSFARSARLAGLIADEMIGGTREVHSCYVNTLSSSVFTLKAVSLAADNWDNHHVVGNQAGACSYFDKTMGVREILIAALNEFSPEEQNIIIKSAKKLSRIFETAKPSDSIDLSFMPPREMKSPINKNNS